MGHGVASQPAACEGLCLAAARAGQGPVSPVRWRAAAATAPGTGAVHFRASPQKEKRL